MAHVGFYEQANGIYEIHSNIFVAAENIKDATKKIKNKTIFIEKNMHIDGIQELINIDGYDIILKRQSRDTTNPIYHYQDIKYL